MKSSQTGAVLCASWLSFLAIGCGGGGTAFRVGGEVPTIALDSSSAPLRPFSLATGVVSHALLLQESYEAQIDGSPLMLVRTAEDRLSWIVPELPTGSHRLSLVLDGVPLELNLDLESRIDVPDPDSALASFLASLVNQIDDLIAALADRPGAGAIHSDLVEFRDRVQAEQASLSGLTQEEVRILVGILANNGLLDEVALQAQALHSVPSAGVSVASLADSHCSAQNSSCDDLQRCFLVEQAKAVRTVSLIAATSLLAGSGFGVPVGVGTALVLGWKFRTQLAVLGRAVQDLVAVCINEGDWGLVGLSASGLTRGTPSLGGGGPVGLVASGLAAGVPVGLVHGVPRALRFMETVPFDPEVRSAVGALRSAMENIEILIPEAWMTWIRDLDSAGGASRPLDPAVLSVKSVSDPNISFEWNRDGEGLQVSARVGTLLSNPAAFSVEILHSRTGTTKSLPAALSFPIDTLVMTPSGFELAVGLTEQVTVRAFDAGGSSVQLPGGDLRWTSGDETVATVDESGLVRAHQGGSASITVTHAPSGMQVLGLVTVGAGCTSEMKRQLEAAVLGDWSVTTSESGNTNRLTIEVGGHGYYTAGDPPNLYPISWVIADWKEPVRIRTLPVGTFSYAVLGVGVGPGCVFHEIGFYHPGFDGSMRTTITTFLLDHTTYFSQPFDPGTPVPNRVYSKL